MSFPLLIAALAAGPADAPGPAEPEPEVVPPAEARREAEDLATFAVLLQDAVTPLYADLDPPEVRSAILPGGDAVFLMELPPVRADWEVSVTRSGEADVLPAWEVARVKAVQGVDLQSCDTCHTDDGFTDWSAQLGADRAARFVATAHAMLGGRRPSPRSAPAPTEEILIKALSATLRDHAGHLPVPAGKRVSVSVKLAEPGAADNRRPVALTPEQRSAIEAQRAEATLIARRDPKVAEAVLTEAASEIVTDLDAELSAETGRAVRDLRAASVGRHYARRLTREGRTLLADILHRRQDLHLRTAGINDPIAADLVVRRLGDIAAELLTDPPPHRGRLAMTAVVRENRSATVGIGPAGVRRSPIPK